MLVMPKLSTNSRAIDHRMSKMEAGKRGTEEVAQGKGGSWRFQADYKLESIKGTDTRTLFWLSVHPFG